MANYVLKFTYMVPWAVLLFLGTVGYKVKRAETSGNGHCSAPSVTEGQQGYLTFNLRQDIQMDAPKFYANLRRAAEPAKDILHCDRANQVSTIACEVTDTSFETDKILKHHSLMVRIPKTTMKHGDLYTLYVYVNGEAETPIVCNFTMQAKGDSKQHGDGKASNAWIAAAVVVPLFVIICGVTAVYFLRKRWGGQKRKICLPRRDKGDHLDGLSPNRTEGDHKGDATGLSLLKSFSAGGDNNSHEEKRWYFGKVTDEEEEKLLQYEQRNGPGSFLVKESNANPNKFVLSVCTSDKKKKIKHLNFCRVRDRLQCHATGKDFKTLCDVVDFYRENDINVDGSVWGKLIKPFDKKPEHEWFIGEGDRKDERRLLLSEGKEPGSFLMREGGSHPKEYILAVNIEGEVVRFPITPQDDGYKLDDSNTTPFRTLSDLVNYYQNNDIIVGDNINRGKLLKPYTGKI